MGAQWKPWTHRFKLLLELIPKTKVAAKPEKRGASASGGGRRGGAARAGFWPQLLHRDCVNLGESLKLSEPPCLPRIKGDKAPARHSSLHTVGAQKCGPFPFPFQDLKG